MTVVANAFVAEAERLATEQARRFPGWLARMRREALADFERLGFPTTKDEDWRFTSVAPIADGRFTVAADATRGVPAERVTELGWGEEAAATLVFVDGRYVEVGSQPGRFPARAHVESLASALARDDRQVEAYLGTQADSSRHAFTALNTTFLDDGAFIHVPDGVTIDRPIHLLFLSGTESTTMAHPRVVLALGANSAATVVESYASYGHGPRFTNAVTEVVAGENATLHHYKIQRENTASFHVGGMYIRSSRNATLTFHSISLGGALVRNDVRVILDGEGSTCTLNGVYVSDGTRLVDNHTTIDHAKPHCDSREVYRGVLADRSRGVFNGKIIVRQDAQKTDAKQTSKALLLSGDAQINTKPELEIFANDVKCTHGAAIGQIDDDAIFYLRARGLDEQQAREMLIRAFAGEVVNQIPMEALRTMLDQAIVARLPGVAGMNVTAAPSRPALDVAALRRDFPILTERAHGKPLVYLDNAATTQKPQSVIDRLSHYYLHENANVHRGVHLLSQLATDAYEGARRTIAGFLHAGDSSEIIFTRGTTEGINLVAQSYGRAHVGAGDEVIVTAMEHHSNIVPWQMLCEEKGAHLRVVPMTDAGELRLDEYERLLSDRTKMVAVVHVSNALGTINPVRQMIRSAHARGIPVLVDGAQAVAHMPVDVQSLDCDFYAFSGHKIFGPTGIGVLYGKAALLDRMPPWQGGGDMISSVTFEKTRYNVLPYKFEAGTPDISGAIGLAAALEYVERVGLDRISEHEHDVLVYGTRALAEIPGLRMTGTAADKAGVLAFVLEGVHPHDIGTILDREGVAIRAGHHCCQPLMDRLGVPATARASLALYNTKEEIDALVAALHKVHEVFG